MKRGRRKFEIRILAFLPNAVLPGNVKCLEGQTDTRWCFVVRLFGEKERNGNENGEQDVRGEGKRG